MTVTLYATQFTEYMATLKNFNLVVSSKSGWVRNLSAVRVEGVFVNDDNNNCVRECCCDASAPLTLT